LVRNRFHVKRPTIYLLDEPEAALSPTRQLEFLRMLREWDASGLAQFIVATDSPILMSYPDAALLSFDGGRIEPTQYTRRPLPHYPTLPHGPRVVLRQLFAEDDGDEQEDRSSED